jgi:hypothetical protein
VRPGLGIHKAFSDTNKKEDGRKAPSGRVRLSGMGRIDSRIEGDLRSGLVSLTLLEFEGLHRIGSVHIIPFA